MNTLKRNSPYIKLLTTSLCIFSWVLVSEVSDVMFGDIFFLSWLSVVLGVFFNVVDTVKLTGLCCSTNCHVFHKFTEVVTHTSPGVFVFFFTKKSEPAARQEKDSDGSFLRAALRGRTGAI